jgi:hypothetical protein
MLGGSTTIHFCVELPNAPTQWAGQAMGESRVSTSRLTLALALALAGVPNRPSRQLWRPTPHNGPSLVPAVGGGFLSPFNRVYKRVLPPLESLHDIDPLALSPSRPWPKN